MGCTIIQELRQFFQGGLGCSAIVLVASSPMAVNNVESMARA
jgi:hypothetical protein